MRISAQSTESVNKSHSKSKLTESMIYDKSSIAVQSVDQQAIEKSSVNSEEQISKEKLQQAVDAINEFLHINHSASKFVLHNGLDRYFVQVVDTQTDEVVKEIPPKKLLDAFYEMQKLVGMVVDEKI
ncbi:flagellar protein FlaG [Lysinibacillus sp. NPDC056232]|uniref:flagellar protein FlaG n=1 Tax=Lysinibacillus sp. NPDC056232 TaxID=3345756 RepID=UPI0035DD0790